MNTKDAIRGTMDMSLFVLNTYIADLSDDELMRRPAAGCNHIAWQIGHLISSEVFLLNEICPGQAAELPAGFAEHHSKEAATSDDRSKFCTKQEYADLYAKVRAATVAALEKLSDEQFDAPSPERFRQMFPTVGQMFTLIATHPMMHAGQLVVVRRQLGKPVVI